MFFIKDKKINLRIVVAAISLILVVCMFALPCMPNFTYQSDPLDKKTAVNYATNFTYFELASKAGEIESNMDAAVDAYNAAKAEYEADYAAYEEGIALCQTNGIDPSLIAKEPVPVEVPQEPVEADYNGDVAQYRKDRAQYKKDMAELEGDQAKYEADKAAYDEMIAKCASLGIDPEAVVAKPEFSMKQPDTASMLWLVQPLFWLTLAALIATIVVCLLPMIKKGLACNIGLAANAVALVFGVLSVSQASAAKSFIATSFAKVGSSTSWGFLLVLLFSIVGIFMCLKGKKDEDGALAIAEVKAVPKNTLMVAKNNPIVVMLAVVCIIVGFTIDRFFSLENFNGLLANTTIRYIIALGVSGALIICGTDLSAGRQAALSATLTGCLVQTATAATRVFPESLAGINMWVVLLMVVVLGACIGTLNGLIVSYLKVPPFIATLGTQTIVYGINLIYTNAQPVGDQTPEFSSFFTKRLLPIGDFNGFFVYILFALMFGLLFWFLYNKTTQGKYMYAIGGNENAAEVSGVNVRVRKTLIFTIAGAMYGFAGFLMCGKSGGASASMGVSYELEAIAGCTIGGVSTTGGIGTVGGILIGVLVFELLKIILQFTGIDPNFNYIAQGLVVISAVAMDIRKYVAKK